MQIALFFCSLQLKDLSKISCPNDSLLAESLRNKGKEVVVMRESKKNPKINEGSSPVIWKSWSFVLVCVCLFSSNLFATFKHETIPNGGFEIWLSEENRPAGWIVTKEGNSSVQSDEQIKLFGDRSIVLNTDNSGSTVKVTTYFLHLDKGLMTLEFWYKTSNNAPVSVVFVNFRTGERWDFDNERWIDGWTAKILPGSQNWVKFEASIPIIGADEYRLSIGSVYGCENSKIWIDNVSLVEEERPFPFETKIGVDMSIKSVSSVPFWSDSSQQETFQNLNLNSVRIEVNHFDVIQSYSQSNGFTYDWSKLDSTISAIISLNPDIEFMFMLAFPAWCTPQGLPFIEVLSPDSTGGCYNFPPDEVMAQFAHDVAMRAYQKGWNVKVWMIHNEPGSNVQGHEDLYPILTNNYNVAAQQIKEIFPDALITMGFINSNSFYDYFVNNSAAYTNCISIHKSGGIDNPVEEMLIKADRWWWHYYCPERRKSLLLEKGIEDVPIIIDEGSMTDPVGGNPLNHTIEEDAYEALMFKYAVFGKALYWHYTPFASFDQNGESRPSLMEIFTKELYPVYWFMKFLTAHISLGDSILYEGESSDKVCTYFVWKNNDELYYLVINPAPFNSEVQVHFIAPVDVAWIYNFSNNSVDSLVYHFEEFIQDTLFFLEPYQVIALRTFDTRTNVRELGMSYGENRILFLEEPIVRLPANFAFPAVLSIYDIQGRTIKKELFVDAYSHREVDLSGLSNGVYFLILKGSEGIYKKTFYLLR